ncbi:MAG TPA: hypothetical protein VFL56_07875 [Solirubrobacterales bacterium]|nr:hypothetical protein [Solirubrobacterales bacterium]
MSDREILERIDRRLEHGDELIASCRDSLDRNSEAFERFISTIDRLDNRLDQFDDRLATGNAFIADMVRRVEVAGQRSDALFEHMIGRLDALTEAVMRMLDRLDGPATA